MKVTISLELVERMCELSHQMRDQADRWHVSWMLEDGTEVCIDSDV